MALDIKIHPDFAHENKKYECLLEKNWQLIEDIDAMAAYGMVITSNSGSALEFASKGVSVIIIASNGAFTTNTMPEAGKGVIWDIAYSIKELEAIFRNLKFQRSQNFGEVRKNADYYLTEFFSPVGTDIIIENFDFKDWVH